MKKHKRKFVDFGKFSPKELVLGEGSDVPGYIAGWASTPFLDHGRDVVAPDAFSKSIADRGISGSRSVKLLLNHASNQVAGSIKSLEYREGKLWIEAQLNLNVSYVKDIYEVAKDVGFNFSVGFRSMNEKTYNSDDGPYTVIFEGDLVEVSIVPFPMNEEASVEYIKTFDVISNEEELSQLLVAKRLSYDIASANEIIAEIRKHLEILREEPLAEQELVEQKEVDEHSTLDAKKEEAVQAKNLSDLNLTTKLHLLLAMSAKMRAGATSLSLHQTK